MERKIPIYNIYNMLCYAWDVLEEKEATTVDTADSSEMIELFSKVLLSGTATLIKRGFDRGYIEQNEEIRGMKGKIDFKNSISKLSFYNAKSYCIYDEFSYNILHNQILKTTITKLLSIKDLSTKTKMNLRNTLPYMHDIQEITLQPKIYKNVVLNRNNHYYKFLISICKLINTNLQIDERTGNYQFMNFLEDEKQMSTLFENFVRNFYKKELPRDKFTVKIEKIDWELNSYPGKESFDLLPEMKTDISIISKDKKLIIDTKYYGKAIKQVLYGNEKFSSNNLYQIYSYVKNSRKDLPTEGILLYPTVNREFDSNYIIQGDKISVKTVDLNQPNWYKIKERLLSFI